MTKKITNPHEPIPTTELHERVPSAREKRLDEKGREIVSPLPMEPPLGYKRQPTMVEIIRQQIQSEHLARDLAAQGVETFEEADDFEVGDDYEPSSPWENEFDPPISELTKAGQEELKKREAAPPPIPPKQESDPAQPVAPAPTGPSPDQPSG